MTLAAVARDAEARFDATEARIDRLRPLIVSAYQRDVAAAASLHTATELTERIEARDRAGALELLGLGLLEVAFRTDLGEILTDAFALTTRVEKAQTVPPLDATKPRAIRLATEHAADSVVGITERTRVALRQEIARALELGQNPRVAARRLRALVGVDARQANAIENLRRSLVEAGRTARQIDGRIATTTKRMVARRAERIARTEILWANNAAAYERWRQAADAGLISARAPRVWITARDERVCAQCAPMHGQVAEQLAAPFVSTVLGLPGEEIRLRPEPIQTEFPPLHPNCRCTVGLA